jgi:hypothetical protein
MSDQLSHADLCRLAQVFLEHCQMSRDVIPHGPGDGRIHDWLKRELARAKAREE